MSISHIVKSTIKNNGSATVYFHITFSEGGYTPFYTSPIQTLAAGASVTLSTTHTPVVPTEPLVTNLLLDSAPTSAPIAEWYATPLSGETPLSFTVVNQTTGTEPITYQWYFPSSGTVFSYVSSTEKTPTGLSYATVGLKSIRLIATSAYGTSNKDRLNYINVLPTSQPVANFSAAPLTGAYPLMVTFTNLSTNATSYLWDFKNDGTATSTSVSPVYTYANPGLYSVKLTATNINGSNSMTKTNYVYVGIPSGIEYGVPADRKYGGFMIGGPLAVTTAEGYSFGGGTLMTPYYSYGVIGGGYPGNTIYTKNELLTALNAAESPAVVYVSPTANIDMGSTFDTNINEGVTLASNRAQLVGGVQQLGGRIYSKALGTGWGKSLFSVTENSVRITGVRLEGEAYPMDHAFTEYTGRVGVRVTGASGFETWNCDYYGFAYANIYAGNCPAAGQPLVHYNYIHGSQNKYEGYGCNVGGTGGSGGHMRVRANVFDRNRHSMTGDGEVGECYEFDYNIITPTDIDIQGMYHIDVHGSTSTGERVSGNTYLIHHNSVLGGRCLGFRQRGYPTSTTVYNNDFVVAPSYIGYSKACNQDGYPDYGHVTCTNNRWNGTEYAGNVGILQVRSYYDGSYHEIPVT